ncbi:cytochrome C [Sulfurimonas sp.]|uniref:cytochrome C n=1 Tax=Sulfurimonas sp. TaxID=2022749 RepID=UPI0035638019
MNKVFLLFITFFILSLSPLSAAVYKGQKVFVKKCVKCHEAGQAFIAKKKIKIWKNLMKKKGKPLADLHMKSNKAEKSWNYFESKKYYKDSKHLKQFLVEYAKDSGNVPACD